MVNQVIYTTDYGNVLAAKSEESYLPGQGGERSEFSDVQVIHTSGGLEFLLGAVAGGLPGQEWNADQLDGFRRVLFESVQESRQRDIPTLMQEAFQTANRSMKMGSDQTSPGWTAIVAAIHEHQLYLAQVGTSRAYLVRENHLLPLTIDPTQADTAVTLGDVLPDEISKRVQQNRLFRFINKDRTIHVETTIHLPDGEDSNSLDLQPGDGIILCQDGLVDNVLLRGRDLHLRGDFISLYSDNSPAVIADRIIQAAGPSVGEKARSIVVMKMDERAAQMVPVPFARGWISQIGLLALILTVSIALGLGAAYAIPAVMNPKPVPNTGVNAAVPSNFISILTADGLVQATLPGQPSFNLATGTVVDAKPGTILETKLGVLKFAMVDGTNVYVANNTSAILDKLADPKVNLMDTVVTLQQGGLIVDSSHASDTQLIVVGSGSDNASATGSFFGVVYSPKDQRMTLDCLEGPCRVTGANASRDLQTGQAASVVNGVVGVANAADWERWASLCDTDCPIQSPNTLPTPTIAPTPQLAPYLSNRSGLPQGSVSVTNLTGMKTSGSIQSNVVPQSYSSPSGTTNQVIPESAVVVQAPTSMPTPTIPDPVVIVNTPTLPPPPADPTAAAPAPAGQQNNPGNGDHTGNGNGNGNGNGGGGGGHDNGGGHGNGNGGGHKKGGGG